MLCDVASATVTQSELRANMKAVMGSLTTTRPFGAVVTHNGHKSAVVVPIDAAPALDEVFGCLSAYARPDGPPSQEDWDVAVEEGWGR